MPREKHTRGKCRGRRSSLQKCRPAASPAPANTLPVEDGPDTLEDFAHASIVMVGNLVSGVFRVSWFLIFLLGLG